jgi:hypothetical protein
MGFTLLNASLLAAPKELISQGRVWIVVRPLQCLDNPWEKDWLANHKKKTAKYPNDHDHAVIKQFFSKKGIEIMDIREKPYVSGEPLCQTCGCERGDTLFLLIESSNSMKMQSFGYDKRFPEAAISVKRTH